MKRALLLFLLAGCSAPDGRQLVVHVRTTLASGDVRVELGVGDEARDGFVLERDADDLGELGSFGVVPDEDANEVSLRFTAGDLVHETRFDDFAPGERTFVFVCLDPATACTREAGCEPETLPAHGAPDAAWAGCLVTEERPPPPPGDDGDDHPEGVRRVTAFGGTGDQLATDVVRVGGETDVVGGRFFDTIDLAGPRAARDEDGFVIALDAAGATTWWLWLTGPGDDAVIALAPGDDGATIVTGEFHQRVEIVGPDGTFASLEARGGSDVFVLVVDAQGAVVEARAFGSALDDRVADIATSPGGIALVGTHRAELDLRASCAWSEPPSAAAALNRGAAFVAVFGASLDCLRGATIYGGEDVFGDAVVIEQSGAVHAAGHTLGSVQAPSALAERRSDIPAPTDGLFDAFLFTLEDDGRISALVEIAGAGEDRVHVLEMSGQGGEFLLAGSFAAGARRFGLTGTIGETNRRVFAARLRARTMAPTWVKDTALDVALAPTAGDADVAGDVTLVASFTGALVLDDVTLTPPIGDAGVASLRFDASGALVRAELIVAGQAMATAYCDDVSGTTTAGAYSGTVDVEGLGLADGVDAFVIRR